MSCCPAVPSVLLAREMSIQLLFHLFSFQLCQAKGFICEFCQKEDDIIFPFELNKCRTCEGEILGKNREGADPGATKVCFQFEWHLC